MGRAGFEPALLYQELGPKPSAYANFATCPWCFPGVFEFMLYEAILNYESEDLTSILIFIIICCLLSIKWSKWDQAFITQAFITFIMGM